MKAGLLSAVSAVALAAVGSANAADMRMPVKAPAVAPAPVLSWTGCYVGAHVGWGWARHDVNTSNQSYRPNVTTGLDADGVLGGGQVGCNYQFAPSWVVGIQGDYAGADIHGSAADPLGVFLNSATNRHTVGLKTDAIASITGRLGVTAWNNQGLFYVKGGGAWAHNKWDLTNIFDRFGAIPAPTETRTGWTVGGGFEWAFVPKWSAFVEFNHYDFGNSTFAAGNVGGGCVLSCFQTYSSSQRIETVKVGFNFRP